MKRKDKFDEHSCNLKNEEELEEEGLSGDEVETEHFGDQKNKGHHILKEVFCKAICF